MSKSTALYTPASIMAGIVSPEQVAAHVAQLRSHMAQRQADSSRGGRANSSNTKVINQLAREIAHFEARS